MNKALIWFVGIGLLIALSACGGGGSSGGTVTTGTSTTATTTGTSLLTYLYVSNRGFAGGGFIKAYEIFTNGLLTEIDTQNIGLTPSGVAVSANGLYLYASHLTANVISQFLIEPGGTLVPLSPATIGLSAAPWSIIAHPTKNVVYIPDPSSSRVYQFSVAVNGQLVAMTPAFVACGVDPRFGFVHPSGDTLYISCSAGAEVRQYSVAVNGSLSPHPTSSIATGAGASSIAMTPAGIAYVYVACETSEEIRVYTVSANHSLVPHASQPVMTTGVRNQAAMVSNDSSYFYTTNYDGTTVLQYDILFNGSLSALSPAIVQAGDGAMPVFSLRGTNVAYVANQGDRTIIRFLVGANGQFASAQSYTTGDPGSGPNGFAIVRQ